MSDDLVMSRTNVANKILEQAYFGDEDVKDTGNWDVDGEEWMVIVFLDGGGSHYSKTLEVIFDADSDAVIRYAIIS